MAEDKVKVDYSEYDSESIDDMIDDFAFESKLAYPLKDTDRYKAKIKFSLVKVISPVSIGDVGSEHIKKARKSFASASEANKNSRESKTSAREHLNKSRSTELSQLKRFNENIANREIEEGERYRIESIQHAKEGANHLKEATKEFVKTSSFKDRKVELRKGVPNIQLYLPVGFQQNDSFQIPGTELGLLGGGVLTGMNDGRGVIDSTMNELSKGLGSIFDMAAGSLTSSQAAVVGARLANKLAPTEVAQAFSLAAGVTVNPNLRSIFKGVNLREYSFQFKFLPKSKKEAEAVEKIIKLFRTYSYPEVINMGSLAAGYNYPDLFRISVFVDKKETVVKEDEEGNEYEETVTKQVQVGNKMKDCYLRSVSTNYNSSSMAFHSDGRPVEVDLALNFVEEVTISRTDIEREGY